MRSCTNQTRQEGETMEINFDSALARTGFGILNMNYNRYVGGEDGSGEKGVVEWRFTYGMSFAFASLWVSTSHL